MLIHKVRENIQHHHLLERGDRVVVAVSGGPDSVALCHLLANLKEEFGLHVVVAHVHHGLRGQEAEADASFVGDLASDLNLPFRLHRVDISSHRRRHRGSVQMAARRLRYRELRRAMQAEAASRLALAHTGDDQAEELLLRIFRGTSPAGLAGMPIRDATGIIRPLLNCQRQEILAYLQQHRLRFREDSSNLKPWCQRNRLRLQLLPLIREFYNSNLSATMLRTSEIAREEEDFWHSVINPWLQQHCQEVAGGGFKVALSQLLHLHPALQRRIIRTLLERWRHLDAAFGFKHVQQVIRLCRGPQASGEVHLPGAIQAEKSYDWLYLGPQPPPARLLKVKIDAPGCHQVSAAGICLEIKEVPGPWPQRNGLDSQQAWVDGERLTFPLTLRSPRPGDRFRPLGLGGSKKLHDFFVDLKVPRRERQRTLLLCRGDDIVWVVGYRIDERFKVSDNSRHILHLRVLGGDEPGACTGQR